MGQLGTQSTLKLMVFMVLSVMFAAFFASLFYITYWRWLPIYEVSGVEPIWWLIYADPYGLFIIPTAIFLSTTLYYYQLIHKLQT